MLWLSQRRSTYAVLLLAALAVRLAAGWWWQARLPEGTQFGFADSETYWQLAHRIARGEPYEFGKDRAKIFRTPGYPILLAGLFRLVGDEPSVLWGRALSAVLGTAAVGGVAWLAGQLFDSRAALVACAAAVVLPDAVAMSTFVLSEAPFCPLMLAQLIAWTAAARSENQKGMLGWALTGGAAAGVATLMRPSWLLFTPFAIAIALVCCRDRRRHLAIGVAMIVGLVATMCPWWVRNYLAVGRFVPTSLQVGASLYDGLHEGATGASEMSFVTPMRAAQRAEDAAAAAPPTGTYEERLDRRMQRESLAWVREHPGRAVLQLAGIKFVRMWNVWPNAAELGSWSLRLVVAVTYVPLMALGLWGVWRFAPREWPYLLCCLPAIYFTALHTIFVSSIRYRQPALLPLLVLAVGVVVDVFWNMRREDRLKPGLQRIADTPTE